jgi:hypothetical protein
MTIMGILTAIIVAWYLIAQPWKPARKKKIKNEKRKNLKNF